MSDGERSDLLTVELGPNGLNLPGRPGVQGIFHDRDERHPGPLHEVLVVAGKVVQAFPTPRVLDAIARRLLRDVTGVKQPTEPQPDVARVMDGERAALRTAPPHIQQAAGVPMTITEEPGTGPGDQGDLGDEQGIGAAATPPGKAPAAKAGSKK